VNIRKPFLLSQRAHRARMSESAAFRVELRSVELQLKKLVAARQQLSVNIRYYETQVRPKLALSLKEKGF